MFEILIIILFTYRCKKAFNRILIKILVFAYLLSELSPVDPVGHELPSVIAAIVGFILPLLPPAIQKTQSFNNSLVKTHVSTNSEHLTVARP